MNARIALCAVCVPLLAACKSLNLSARPVHVERPAVQTARGVVMEDLFLGSGVVATTGDRVLLDYTLWLDGDQRVDSTLDRGVPVELVIGDAAVVRGLDEGLIGMRADGRRRITVPAELGYGELGVTDLIPPNAELRFDVHVLEVRSP